MCDPASGECSPHTLLCYCFMTQTTKSVNMKTQIYKLVNEDTKSELNTGIIVVKNIEFVNHQWQKCVWISESAYLMTKPLTVLGGIPICFGNFLIVLNSCQIGHIPFKKSYIKTLALYQYRKPLFFCFFLFSPLLRNT